MVARVEVPDDDVPVAEIIFNMAGDEPHDVPDQLLLWCFKLNADQQIQDHYPRWLRQCTKYLGDDATDEDRIMYLRSGLRTNRVPLDVVGRRGREGLERSDILDTISTVLRMADVSATRSSQSSLTSAPSSSAHQGIGFQQTRDQVLEDTHGLSQEQRAMCYLGSKSNATGRQAPARLRALAVKDIKNVEVQQDAFVQTTTGELRRIDSSLLAHVKAISLHDSPDAMNVVVPYTDYLLTVVKHIRKGELADVDFVKVCEELRIANPGWAQGRSTALGATHLGTDRDVHDMVHDVLAPLFNARFAENFISRCVIDRTTRWSRSGVSMNACNKLIKEYLASVSRETVKRVQDLVAGTDRMSDPMPAIVDAQATEITTQLAEWVRSKTSKNFMDESVHQGSPLRGPAISTAAACVRNATPLRALSARGGPAKGTEWRDQEETSCGHHGCQVKPPAWSGSQDRATDDLHQKHCRPAVRPQLPIQSCCPL